MMFLNQAINDYLAYIKLEQGVTQSTFKCYQCYLNHFAKWSKLKECADPTLDSLDSPKLRQLLYYLSEKGLRPRAILGYFHPLRGLGKWLVARQVISENPTLSITLPKKDAAKREVT